MSTATDFPDDGEKSVRDQEERAGAESVERAPRAVNLSFLGRIADFYSGVKLEMRKTTWPSRTEVWSTTVVVLIAVLFFGFYLWGVDRLVTLGFEALEKAIR